MKKQTKNPTLKGLVNASMFKEAKASCSLDGETQCGELPKAEARKESK